MIKKVIRVRTVLDVVNREIKRLQKLHSKKRAEILPYYVFQSSKLSLSTALMFAVKIALTSLKGA